MKNKFIYIILIGLLSNFGVFAQELLTLEQAISIGLEKNYDIEISKQQTQIAETANTWGMAGRYPTIGFMASTKLSSDVTNTDTTDPALNTVVGANFQWLLFGGMRVSAKKSILNLQHDLAQGTEQLQIENSIKDIILAYYSVVIESKLSELYGDVLTLSKDRYQREKMAYEIGVTDTYNLVQAESAYLSDKKLHVQQQRMVKLMTYQLNTLINTEVEKQWLIDTNIPIPESNYSLPLMEEMMLSSNSSIKNQYINQRITEQNIREAKSNLYPSISIVGDAGFSNMYPASKIPSIPNNQFVIGIGATVNYNIYSGGVVKKNIQISKLNNEILQIATQKMELYLTSQLHSSYDSYLYNRELVELGTREMTVAKTSLDLSYDKYTNGAISSFDFRQIQVVYSQAVYSQMRYMFELIKSNTELLQITGGILTSIHK